MTCRMTLLLCGLLPAIAPADFLSGEVGGDANRNYAVEAAQCSGYTEFMAQLTERASRAEDSRLYQIKTVALQTLAAMTFINKVGLSEEEATTEVYRIAGISANTIAQHMLQDFELSQEVWREQCHEYFLEARKIAESTGLISPAPISN